MMNSEVARHALVRATKAESAGAGMRVAGLSVVERSIKQLAALKMRVLVASDGSCTIPTLPAVEIRMVTTPVEIQHLRAEFPNAIEVGADEVRPVGRELQNSIRVTDEASCKQAEDAVFAQLLRGDLGLVARHLNKPVSFRITRYLLCYLPFTPNIAMFIRSWASGFTYGEAAWADSAGNLYVTGSTTQTNSDLSIITLKYNAAGDSLWTRQYAGPRNAAYANAITGDRHGNIFVTGDLITPSYAYEYVTMSYNASGSLQWSATFADTVHGTDQPVGIALDSQGNIYVTGNTYVSQNSPFNAMATVKYSTDGAAQWVASFSTPGNGYDNAAAIGIDDSGYVYTVGTSFDLVTTNNIVLIKTAPNGDTLWTRLYDGNGNPDEPTAMKVDHAGNCYITGRSWNGALSSSADYITMKYNSAGVRQWATTYNGTGSNADQANAIAIDAAGNVQVGYNVCLVTVTGSSQATLTAAASVAVNDPAHAIAHRHAQSAAVPLGGRHAFLFVKVHGDAAAIIDYGDGVIVVNGDADFGCIACQGFVHRIVHYLVDQVMEPHLARRADIHRRSKAHGLQPFQHLDAG